MIQQDYMIQQDKMIQADNYMIQRDTMIQIFISSHNMHASFSNKLLLSQVKRSVDNHCFLLLVHVTEMHCLTLLLF